MTSKIYSIIRIDVQNKTLSMLALLLILTSTFIYGNETANTAKNARAVYSQEWLGWGGAVKNNSSRAMNAPQYWSPQHNVMWKTDLVGNGHSSPIVVGDKVLVTAAYEIEQATYLKKAINLLVFGLLLLIGIATIRHISRYCRTQEYFFQNIFRTTNVVALGVVLTILSAFILFGENALDFSQDSIRSWIASTIAMALCLFMYTLSLPRNSRKRLFAGISFIVLTIPFIFFVPQKDYIFKGGFFTLRESALVVYALAGFLMFLGILLTVIYILNRKKADTIALQEQRELPNYKFLINMVITGGLILFTIGLIALAAIIAINSFEVLSYQYNKPSFNTHLENRYTPVLGWWCIYIFVSVLLASFLFSIKKEMQPQASQLPARRYFKLKGYELLLGVIVFININFMALNLEHTRAIISFDRLTGKKLWACEELTSPVEDVHRLNSMATPTPVSNRDKVYGYFGKSGIICSDLNGNTVWTNKEFDFENIHGAATSPVLEDSFLVILGDQPKSAYIAVLNANTGKTIWKQERTNNKAYFNGSSRTPQVTSIDGQKVIVAWGWEDLRFYKLQDGEDLASYKLQHQNGDSMCSSPIIYDGLLYLVQKRTILALSLQKLIRNENPVIWKSRVRGPFVASPVISNDLLFTVSEKGIVYCFDVYSGERMWEKKMKSEYYPSPIAIGNQIYICNNDGETTIFAAERECRIISDSNLGEETFSSFAFADGQLFIRTQNRLYCIQEFSAPQMVYAE